MPAALSHLDLLSTWSWEPAVCILLAITTSLYVLGAARAWRHSGAGRGLGARRLLCFAGALLALIVALLSPLDALSGQLFTAHMVQHLLLIMLAAPLLVLSDLPLAWMWALPRRWAQGLGQWWNHTRWLARAWHAVSSPIGAWLLFAIPLWAWHASAFYDEALANETIHILEHLILLLSAMLFWWVLFRHTTAGHIHYGMAVFYLFTTSVHSNVLGALMTFTTQPWYPAYAATAPAWGLTAMQDQQLAGLLMWIPGGAVFTVLNIAYFAAWFRALEQRSRRSGSLLPPHGD